jgi:hypothetical protein
MVAGVEVCDLHPAAVKVVQSAVERGWTARNIACERGRTQAGVLLVSPTHPGVTLRIYPVRQWNHKKLRTVMNKVETYGRAS